MLEFGAAPVIGGSEKGVNMRMGGGTGAVIRGRATGSSVSGAARTESGLACVAGLAGPLRRVVCTGTVGAALAGDGTGSVTTIAGAVRITEDCAGAGTIITGAVLAGGGGTGITGTVRAGDCTGPGATITDAGNLGLAGAPMTGGNVSGVNNCIGGGTGTPIMGSSVGAFTLVLAGDASDPAFT